LPQEVAIIDAIAVPRFFREVEDAIAEAEGRSAAEIVVAVSPWSGSYRDTDLLMGVLPACIALALMLFSPFAVSPYFVLPELLAVFAVGFYLARKRAAGRRWLTSPRRRARQVAQAAALAFYDEGVANTEARTGLLIYVSLGEETAVVLADCGLTARIPEPHWQELARQISAALRRSDWAGQLAQAIRETAGQLAAQWPPAADDVDEIPNSIRMRR